MEQARLGNDARQQNMYRRHMAGRSRAASTVGQPSPQGGLVPPDMPQTPSASPVSPGLGIEQRMQQLTERLQGGNNSGMSVPALQQLRGEWAQRRMQQPQNFPQLQRPGYLQPAGELPQPAPAAAQQAAALERPAERPLVGPARRPFQAPPQWQQQRAFMS